MRSGLASWLGFDKSDTSVASSSSLFNRFNLWNTNTPDMGRKNTKNKSSPEKNRRNIEKSIEIDDEPDVPGNSRTRSSSPKKVNDKNMFRKISPKKKIYEDKIDLNRPSSSHSKQYEKEIDELTSEEKTELLSHFKGQLLEAEVKGDEDSYDKCSEVIERISLTLSPKSNKRRSGINNPETPRKKLKSSPSKSPSKPKKSARSTVTSTDDDEEHVIFCLICEESEGSLIQCGICEHRFHSACIELELPLEYPEVNWICYDCITCSECKEYIDDSDNVQCTKCGKAYHGRCNPDDSVCVYPFKRWYCMECLKGFKKTLNKKQTKYLKKIEDIIDEGKSEKEADSDDDDSMLPSRKLIQECYQYKELPLQVPSGVVRPVVNPSKKTLIEVELKNKSLRLLNKKYDEFMLEEAKKEDEMFTKENYEISDILTVQGQNKFVKINGTMQPTLQQYQKVWPSKETIEKFKASQLNRSKSLSKSPKSKTTSKKKTPTKFDEKAYEEDMRKYLYNFSFPEIVDEFMDIREKAKILKDREEKVLQKWIDNLYFDEDIVQYLHIGTKHMIPVSRHIPSNDPEIAYSKLVFVCHKCFTLFLSGYKFNIHLKLCEFTHPPGREIYREKIVLQKGKQKTISFFEIVGERHIDYCRNLSTVASALLLSKAVTQEVDMFKFYILTEFDEYSGYVPAGFFSKENKPSQNNNLSCLLVFNHYRQSGYGKLLVDLSYMLSRREKKYGSPEHPLSDDGLYLYRSYWKSSIFEYIRKHRKSKKISFEDISKDTHIYIDDIVSTLLVNGMIKQLDDGKTLIDCVKPWFTNIKTLRRRTVNPDKLRWDPPFVDSAGEHNEYYVCDSSDDDS